jgi:hypothetical protein
LQIVVKRLSPRTFRATFRRPLRFCPATQQEFSMIRSILKVGAVAVLLMSSGAAFADDPTGVLLQQKGHHRAPGGGHAISYVGPCGAGTQSQSFPNAQGFRCVPKR